MYSHTTWLTCSNAHTSREAIDRSAGGALHMPSPCGGMCVPCAVFHVRRYDSISAYELFRRTGVSRQVSAHDTGAAAWQRAGVLAPCMRARKYKNCVCVCVCVCVQAYEQWLRPTVLVGLFAPPEQISAASMLETVWCFSVAHQSDMGESIRAPYATVPCLAYVRGCACMHRQMRA